MREKKDFRKIRLVILFYHLSFWLAITLLTINYLLSELDALVAIGISIYYTLLLCTPFYINYFFLAKYIFQKKQYLVYTVLIILLIAFPLLIINYTEFGWLFIDEATYSKNLDLIVNYSYVILISNLFKGIEIWLHNRQRESQIEKEKLQAELNFLRIQINPHFLFNALNNIYSLAYTKDEKAAPMIAKLSQIMRYMLNDCNNGRVSLTKEIEVLKSYIDLQLLKIGQDRNIDLYTEGINTSHKIAPLLLLTFLENSFKHGDISTNEKGWIKIECIVEDNNLCFNITNSISQKSKEKPESSGIGLANIKKQLELNYTHKHELKIVENPGNYTVNLNIKLD